MRNREPGMKREEWRDVPGYGGWYQINRFGEVRSYRQKGNRHSSMFRKKRDKPVLLRPYQRRHGLFVKLTDVEGKSRERNVSRIMADVWLGGVPDGCMIWREDGDPTNTNVCNLKVTSKSEFIKRSHTADGFKDSRIKYRVLKLDTSLEIVECYRSGREAAKRNNFSYQAILDRCNLRLKRMALFAADGYIYAWDDEKWLQRTLARAAEELDACGMRHNAAAVEYRDNPPYDPDHCFTVTRCEKCGEFYEADKPHICRRRNSWPFRADDEKGDEK